MLYPHYKTIKERLTAQVPGLKTTEWFNNQYAGIIHAEQLALIEFPDGMDIIGVTKSTYRTKFPVRIHVISRAVSDADEVIGDDQLQAHDALVNEVLTALRLWLPEANGVPLSTSLVHTRYQAVHEYKGWLVTWLTFTTKMVLL